VAGSTVAEAFKFGEQIFGGLFLMD